MTDGPQGGDEQLLDAPLLDAEAESAVISALAGLPEIPMPDDVADRIAAALALEVPLSGPVPAWAAGGSTNVSVLPSQRERDQRRHRVGRRVLSGAAGLVLVLGTVVIGTQFFQGSDPEVPTVAGGATSDTAKTPVEGTLLTTSGATYTPADIDTRVASLVTAASAPGAPLRALDSEGASVPPSEAPSTKAYTTNDVVVDDTARSACVAKLVETTGEQPLAVDAGAWSGSATSPSPGQSPSQAPSPSTTSVPAVIVVLSDDDPAQVAVFVVSAKCADAGDLDAHVLYFAFVPRR